LPQYWARKDEDDGEFLTVALAILTVSLSHVPNKWLKIPDEELADMMRSCLGGLEKLVDDMLEVGIQPRVQDADDYLHRMNPRYQQVRTETLASPDTGSQQSSDRLVLVCPYPWRAVCRLNKLRRNAVWNNLNRKARAQTSTGLLLSAYHQLRLYDPLVSDGCKLTSRARSHIWQSYAAYGKSFHGRATVGVRLII
jgi:hypothetical protein